MDQFSWIGAFGAWANALNWQDLTTGQNPAATPPGATDAATIAGFSLLVIVGPGPPPASHRVAIQPTTAISPSAARCRPR